MPTPRHREDALYIHYLLYHTSPKHQTKTKGHSAFHSHSPHKPTTPKLTHPKPPAPSSSSNHETHPPRSNPRRHQHITLISSTHPPRPHKRSCKRRRYSTVGPTSEEIDCARIRKLTIHSNKNRSRISARRRTRSSLACQQLSGALSTLSWILRTPVVVCRCLIVMGVGEDSVDG
jgi:hypothetical protein